MRWRRWRHNSRILHWRKIRFVRKNQHSNCGQCGAIAVRYENGLITPTEAYNWLRHHLWND